MVWESSCNLEHLTGTFAIRCGDERGVDVEESSLLEELVGGVCQVVPDTGHTGDELGPWSQMGDGSEVLDGVSLWWQWIGIAVTLANHLDLVSIW